jgi:hypothetical protein
MNAEPSWKKSRRLLKMHALSAVCAMACALSAKSEIVLSVTPDENVQKQQKSGINVPNPMDDTGVKPASAKDPGDILKFINNDQLHGSLIGIDEKRGVRW